MMKAQISFLLILGASILSSSHGWSASPSESSKGKVSVPIRALPPCQDYRGTSINESNENSESRFTSLLKASKANPWIQAKLLPKKIKEKDSPIRVEIETINEGKKIILEDVKSINDSEGNLAHGILEWRCGDRFLIYDFYGTEYYEKDLLDLFSGARIPITRFFSISPDKKLIFASDVTFDELSQNGTSSVYSCENRPSKPCEKIDDIHNWKQSWYPVAVTWLKDKSFEVTYYINDPNPDEASNQKLKVKCNINQMKKVICK